MTNCWPAGAKVLFGGLVAAVLLLHAPLAGAPRPVALLTDATAVRIKRAGAQGQFQPLRADHAFLNPGDLVRVDAGGTGALWQIYRSYGQLWLAPKQTVGPVAALHRPQGDPHVTSADYEGVEKQYVPTVRQALLPSPTTAGTPVERPTFILTPRHGLILSGRPSFEWSAAPGADAYEIVLYDALEKEVWQGMRPRSMGVALPYPEGQPPLRPGRYKWEVTALKDGMPLREPDGQMRAISDIQPFSVATEGQMRSAAAALKRASGPNAPPSEAARLYALACLQHRQYRAAERRLLGSLRTAPDSEPLRKLLLRVYWLMERWADRERLRRAGSREAWNQVLGDFDRAYSQ